MKVKVKELKEKDREMEAKRQQHKRQLDAKEEQFKAITKPSFDDRKAANDVSLLCFV